MLLAPILIIAAGVTAYVNSFSGVFLFDDKVALLEIPRANWTISSLLGGTLRPVVKLSLALNALWGGPEQVWSYHAVNLAIHLLAALTLFGLIRRTLQVPRLTSRYGQAASWLALVITLLWVVHPLQTQSVTYVIQRGESLMGLWYLLVLYALVRSTQSCSQKNRGQPPQSGVRPLKNTSLRTGSDPTVIRWLSPISWWQLLGVVSCVLGMLTKPVMVTAPLVALLYDRIFLARSWRQLFQERGQFHGLLGMTWLCLPMLVQNVPPSSEWTAGFDTRFAPSPWSYARTQPGVLLHYLRLAFWPHPLVFDYAWPLAKSAKEIWPPVFAIITLCVLTGWALKRVAAIGFLGAAFFLILAPTSSFYPLADPAFEYRMYLPLTAVLTLIVVGGYELLRRSPWSAQARRIIAAGGIIGVVGGFTLLTLQRNTVYASEEVLWRDTIAKRPLNARAHHNLGRTLATQERLEEAVSSYQEAVRLSPTFAIAHNNLGVALRKQGKLQEALMHYRHALRFEPRSAQAHNNAAVVLRQLGDSNQALAHYTRALELDPNYAQAHTNLGVLLATQGRFDEAIRHFQEALRIHPRDATAQANLAIIQQQHQMPLHEAD